MWELAVMRWMMAAALAVVATVAAAQDKPRIVAVNYPLQYFAQRLAGDAAQVSFPVPAGVDPAFWRPGIADISAIQSADLILLNGAGFATWVDRVSLPRSKIVNTSAAVSTSYIQTETITHSHGDGGEHSHQGVASYVWLDPTLATAQAQAVAAALTARGLVDPSDMAPRLAALQADLAALDAQTRVALADLGDTVLITTHPRYQYFARAYGLTVHALEWEAGAAPDAEQLAALGALADKTGGRVLIWEAEPTAEAFAATAALGLQNLTFPPLAGQPDGANFLQVFAGAVADLAAAAAPGN